MKRFLLNIAANQSALLISILVALFLTPFIVHSLGATKYGIWALAGSLTGQYGLLTFGIRGGLTRYLAKSLASEDYLKASQYFSTAIFLMLIVGILTLLVGGSLSIFFDKIFTIPSHLRSESKLVCFLIAGATAITFFGSSFHALLAAAQRFDVISIIGIVLTLFRAIFTVLVLTSGFGLIGLAILSIILNFVGSLSEIIAVAFLFRNIEFNINCLNKRAFKKLVSYGSKSFVINVSDALIFQIDLFVIGLSLKPNLLAVYSLGAALNNYFIQFVSAITRTFGPFATAKFVTEGKESLSKFFFDAGQSLFIISGIALGGVLFFGNAFFKLWIGPDFGESFVILIILMTAQFFAAGAKSCNAIFVAMGCIGPLAILSIIEGLFNLLLSLSLVKQLSIVGVALGTLIPMVLNSGIWAPYYACNLLRLSLSSYYVHTLFVGIISFLITAVFSWILTSIPYTLNWFIFGMQVIIVILLSVLFISLIGYIFQISVVKAMILKLTNKYSSL